MKEGERNAKHHALNDFVQCPKQWYISPLYNSSKLLKLEAD